MHQMRDHCAPLLFVGQRNEGTTLQAGLRAQSSQKLVTTLGRLKTLLTKWVSGNDEDDACCSSCGRYCNNVFDYNTLRCLWCKKIRHRSCNADNLHCDYGEYSSISILPSEVENVELEEDLTIKHVTFNIDPSKDIVIFVINRLSGPQFGEEIIEHLYKYFNPAQVIDLLDGEIQDIKLFKGIPGLKVVVGGGDGTVSSISSVVRDLLGEKVPVIPMPLGTGNDLSRAIGWGGALNTVEELHHYIQKLQGRPKATYIDRWSITAISGIDLTPFRGKDRGKAYIQRLLNKKRNGGSTQDKQSSQEDKDKSADRPEDEQREILLDEQMFLYCGFGIGGQFSYKFNKIREQYPNLFKSRVNLLTFEYLSNSLCIDWKQIHVQSDGGTQNYKLLGN